MPEQKFKTQSIILWIQKTVGKYLEEQSLLVELRLEDTFN